MSDMEEIVVQLEALRTEGNDHFKAKQYGDAVGTYTRALNLLPSTVEDAKAKEQQVLLLSNRAACLLQLNKYTQAHEDCTKALDLDSSNSKARYRRAQASFGLNDLTPAFQDVRQVLQQTPNNKSALTLAQSIKEKAQEDVHGIRKALDCISHTLLSEGQAAEGAEKDPKEALQFLAGKCASDTATMCRDLELKGGVPVLWRVVKKLLETDQTEMLQHAAGTLAVVASASSLLAQKVYETGLPSGGLQALLEHLHSTIASEYSGKKQSLDNGQVACMKSIVKLAAFLFSHLLMAQVDGSQLDVRRSCTALMDGLRSRSLELRLCSLDGFLHLLSMLQKSDVALIQQKCSTLMQELGIFQLLHATACDTLQQKAWELTEHAHLVSTAETLLSRLPLVFTQCLSLFESDESTLQNVALSFCIAPVVSTKLDKVSMEEEGEKKVSLLLPGAASCLLLSCLFLQNSKLAVWSVKQEKASGFLSQLCGMLELSNRSLLLNKQVTRELQELWVDCVASVCGSKEGVELLPPPLVSEVVKISETEMDVKSHDDLLLRASALSVRVKMTIMQQQLEDFGSGEGKVLVDKVVQVLVQSHASEMRDQEQQLYWSGSAPKERAVEALSYLITQTQVKDSFVKEREAVASVFNMILPSNEKKHGVGYRSNVYFGVLYILLHLVTSESALKKKQMEGMELSADQYEELQKALKQKSALEDGDSKDQIKRRVACLMQEEKVWTTLVSLIKWGTKQSSNVVDMGLQAAFYLADQAKVRGRMVQTGVLQALLPLSFLQDAQKKMSDKAQMAAHTMSKILVTTNPNMIGENVLLSFLKPLLDLCKQSTSQLAQFEALLALTNVLSVSDSTKKRVLQEPQGLHTLEYLQFSDHELVRRAATESLTNLLPSDEIIEKVFLNGDKVKLWVALSSLVESERDEKTSEAALGALAMVSQVPAAAYVMIKKDGVDTFAEVVEGGENEDLVVRAIVALQNIVQLVQNTPRKEEVESVVSNVDIGDIQAEVEEVRKQMKDRNGLKAALKRWGGKEGMVKGAAAELLQTMQQL